MSSVILIVICYVYFFFTTIDPRCTLPSNEYASLESDNGEVAPLCPFIISSGVDKVAVFLVNSACTLLNNS